MKTTRNENVNWGALIAKIVDQTKVARPVMEFYVDVLRARDELMLETGAAPPEKGSGTLPLFGPADFTIDVEAVVSALKTFLSLNAGNHPILQDNLQAILKLFNDRYFEDAALLLDVSRGDFAKIERLSAERRMDVGLLVFLAHSAVKARLQPALRSASAGLSLDSWRRGTCPVCGSRPHLAYMEPEAKEKTLCCALCDQQWAVDALFCPFCDQIEAAAKRITVPGLPQLWAEICATRGAYLKGSFSRSAVLNKSACLDDLASMRLDYAAIEEGYARLTSIPS